MIDANVCVYMCLFALYMLDVSYIIIAQANQKVNHQCDGTISFSPSPHGGIISPNNVFDLWPEILNANEYGAFFPSLAIVFGIFDSLSLSLRYMINDNR